MLVKLVDQQRGFSLIELIAGIVAFSAVMVVVITLVINQSRQSIDPIWQTRASELAQSLASEISSRAFDENSTISGGFERCGDTGNCSAVGPDSGEVDGNGSAIRSLFDDVDDYDGLIESAGTISDALGDQIVLSGDSLYTGFSTQVSVSYDATLYPANPGGVKRIDITVTTPGNQDIHFAFYRWDY